MKEKSEYLLLNPVEDIPEEYNLNRWTNFLPPLKKFNIIKLDGISESFKEELSNELLNGSNKLNDNRLDKMLVIESKIISYSLAIQECIQKIVDKKDLVLKASNKLFMDNACCNEIDNKSMTTLQYFINEDNNINNYSNIILELSATINDVRILTSGAMMISIEDTKRQFPLIMNDISEENIYRAFITLCKFQSSVPLYEELKSVCNDKPDYLGKMDSIQEMIEKLKRDGRNYKKDDFLRLFQIVSRKNIISISLDEKYSSCVNRLNNALKVMEDENNEYVPKSLRQKLENLAESYGVLLKEDTKEMTDLKNYLDGSNKNMRKELIDFIKNRGGLKKSELDNITEFITKMSEWRFDVDVRNVDIKISDDGLYNYINYFKNMIELSSITLPSMIINEQIQTIKVPKYWNLHSSHSDDIMEMITSFYGPLQKYYGNISIKNVLKEVLNRCNRFNLLAGSTPVLTSIKLGEEEIYSVFDKRTTTLLYEYYILSVLIDYKNIVDNSSMVKKLLVVQNSESGVYRDDFIIEQELKLSESDQDFIQGSVMTLKKDVAGLLITIIKIMMKTKNTINMSYNDIQLRVFGSKESEKYNVTDRFKDMDDSEREIDNILKINKIGPIWSRGLKKGLREYDKDDYEETKYEAEKTAATAKKMMRERGRIVTDDEIFERIDEEYDAEDINDIIALENDDQMDMYNDDDERNYNED
jgi:hypothetical protein